MNLCLIPGWGLGTTPLLTFSQALAAHIAPTRLLPLPGYEGRPALPDFFTAAQELGQEVKADSILVGWSLGAMLALAFAAHSPPRALVLISGTASFVRRPHWPHGLEAETLLAFRRDITDTPIPTITQFVRGFNRGDRLSKAIFRELTSDLELSASSTVLGQGLDWLGEIDLCPLIHAVRSPTLLIHGENDPLMPLSSAQALAQALPDATLSVLPQRAHAPFAIESEEALQAITDFVGGLDQ